MDKTIGVFVGSASSFNLVRAASRIGQALSKEFTTHLISSNENLVNEVECYFNKAYYMPRINSISREITILQSYLRTASPDALFQITNPPIHGTIVGTFATIHGIPFVYRYSGDRFYEYQISNGGKKVLHYGLNNVLGRMPIHFADKCIALGPTGVCRLEDRGVDRTDISIIPPIIDQDQFTPTGKTASFGTDRHIGLFVGRISRKKGKNILEETLPKILDRRRDIEFVFIGKQLESLNIPQQYEDHITMVGPISPDKISQYYRGADFVIHPSLTEGVPRVVLEALACGVPTIARDVGDISFATENTFQTDSEFIDKVCSFESLDVDSVDKFSFDSVSEDYINIFKKLFLNR